MPRFWLATWRLASLGSCTYSELSTSRMPAWQVQSSRIWRIKSTRLTLITSRRPNTISIRCSRICSSSWTRSTTRLSSARSIGPATSRRPEGTYRLILPNWRERLKRFSHRGSQSRRWATWLKSRLKTRGVVERRCTCGQSSAYSSTWLRIRLGIRSKLMPDRRKNST